MLKRHYFVVETVAVKNCFKPPRAGFFAIQWHLMTFRDVYSVLSQEITCGGQLALQLYL